MATRRISNIPIHSIVRNPVFHGCQETTSWTRGSAFDNTLTKLEDPATGRQLWLVGTTHGSTSLAVRTRNLIQEVNPDHVMVQTSEEWGRLASHVDASSQEDMTPLNKSMASSIFSNNSAYNFRGLYFRYNFAGWKFLLDNMLGFNQDFHPLSPGLEMKYAIEAARSLNVEPNFVGGAFDGETMVGLETETSVHPFNMFLNILRFNRNESIGTEFAKDEALRALRSQEAYSESIDTTGAYWWTYVLNYLAPEAKKVIIDDKDDNLFLKLYRESSAERTVAVVNHWHVPGIEARWRAATDTIVETSSINPVGDMDINSMRETELENDMLMRLYCKRQGTEPATSEVVIVQYMDTTHEHERARHAFFLGAEDPHLNHCLYNDENQGVEYLNEEMQGLADHHQQ